MKTNHNKYLSRTMAIVAGSGSAFFKAFSVVLISLMVVRFCSINLWGAFTSCLVTNGVLIMLTSFGSKDFLIREFSKAPAGIMSWWSNVFYSRVWIVLVSVFFLAFTTHNTTLFMLSTGWLILNFIAQSFESFIAYFRAFTLSILTEITGTLFICTAVFAFRGQLSLNMLLACFLISSLTKCVWIGWYFRKWIQPPDRKNISLKNLQTVWPFFLMTAGGYLLDRADLLCVSYLLPDTQKASYQILTGMSTVGLIGVSALLAPFTKNLYRMKEEAFARLRTRYVVAAVAFAVVFNLVVYGVCYKFYDLRLSPLVYFLMFAAQIIFVIYFPLMILYTKYNWQKKAVVMVLASGTLTLVMSWLLVPGLELEGAILASVAGHFILWVIQYRYYKKNAPHD